MSKALYLSLALLLTPLAQAAIDTYEFADDAHRQRYRVLVEELRCPKCQNQNIADSNAPIAMDLRQEIYHMLEAGLSDEQIVAHLVSRYGDFVRYNPPINSKTWLLWFGPGLLLVLGGGVLGWVARRHRQTDDRLASENLSDSERERLAALLEDKNL